jgi:hypothetical protein
MRCAQFVAGTTVRCGNQAERGERFCTDHRRPNWRAPRAAGAGAGAGAGGLTCSHIGPRGTCSRAAARGNTLCSRHEQERAARAAAMAYALENPTVDPCVVRKCAARCIRDAISGTRFCVYHTVAPAAAAAGSPRRRPPAASGSPRSPSPAAAAGARRSPSPAAAAGARRSPSPARAAGARRSPSPARAAGARRSGSPRSRPPAAAAQPVSRKRSPSPVAAPQPRRRVEPLPPPGVVTTVVSSSSSSATRKS